MHESFCPMTEDSQRRSRRNAMCPAPAIMGRCNELSFLHMAVGQPRCARSYSAREAVCHSIGADLAF